MLAWLPGAQFPSHLSCRKSGWSKCLCGLHQCNPYRARKYRLYGEYRSLVQNKDKKSQHRTRSCSEKITVWFVFSPIFLHFIGFLIFFSSLNCDASRSNTISFCLKFLIAPEASFFFYRYRNCLSSWCLSPCLELLCSPTKKIINIVKVQMIVRYPTSACFQLQITWIS